MNDSYETVVQKDGHGHVIRSLDPATRIAILPDDAILHVDIQTAFMRDHVWRGMPTAGGGLAVDGAHEVVDVVLGYADRFDSGRRYISLDQHPYGHIADINSYRGLAPFTDLTFGMVESWSDRDNPIKSPYFDRDYLLFYLDQTFRHVQTLWWQHGVMGSEQAELHPGLRHLGHRQLIIKGADPKCDSYSPFLDNMRRPTGLGESMCRHGVKRLFVDGIAYNVCAGWGALHARHYGFEVFVIKDATRSVPIPGLEKMMDERLLEAGVHIITSDMLHDAQGG